MSILRKIQLPLLFFFFNLCNTTTALRAPERTKHRCLDWGQATCKVVKDLKNNKPFLVMFPQTPLGHEHKINICEDV